MLAGGRAWAAARAVGLALAAKARVSFEDVPHNLGGQPTAPGVVVLGLLYQQVFIFSGDGPKIGPPVPPVEPL